MIERRIVVLVGVMLLLLALFLTPPIFEHFFSVDYLLNHERNLLSKWSILVFVTACLILVIRHKINASLSLPLFGLVCMVMFEFGFRAIAHFTFSSDLKWELEKDGLRTYPQYQAYAGHPFLHFTKQPLRDITSKDYKNPYEYNSLGFNDREHSYLKPQGTFRIAALGASTTERGYPQLLEQILDSVWRSESNIEVLNFGVSSWTSAHSMINFLLNVVEFDPDMIIIHHGWNEAEVMNSPDQLFRPDYSHAFTYFHEPERIDGLIVRTCLIYRFTKMKLKMTEDWMFLDRAAMKRDRPYIDKQFNDTIELRPYKRNIQTIIDHALMRNIQVVLTTMPYNTEMLDKTTTIQHCNRIARMLKADYGERILLSDLDSLMTGLDNSVFIDAAHLTELGKYRKARHLADQILHSTLQTPNSNE